jgi:hypothetical protein
MTSSRLRRIAGTLLGLSVALCATTTSAAPRPTPRPKAQPAPGPPTPAVATSIEVTVVQVAGTQAFLKPGARGGVHRGAKVIINRKEYQVIQTSDSFAVIDVGSEPAHEQDKGQSTVVGSEVEKAKELDKPQPLSKWEHAWTEEEAPANAQRPRFVPLGTTERDRRWDVTLSIAGGGYIPLGQPTAGLSYAQLDARVHAEPFDAPAALDLDVSLQRWFAGNIDARDGAVARPTLWLRELLFSYHTASLYASLGRMRYAASTLGPLDGARVRTPLGDGFAVGAFGGLLPNPLSGEPSLSAQRFGVEATYSRPEDDLRPEAALVMHGSMFGGALDERRIAGNFGVYPGPARLGGFFEVTNFDTNNPWRASAVELTAAGLDTSARMGIFQFGGRLDLRQPERSRWLASMLPTSWFCRTVPGAPGVSAGGEPCDGSVSTRAVASVDASVEIDNVSLTVGGTTARDLTQAGGAPDMTGGFAAGRVVRIQKIARIDASASYSQATYLDMLQGSAGPGVTLFDNVLDLSVYFRSASLRYRSVSASLLQQGLGFTVGVFPSSEVIFTVQSEATVGDDSRAFLLFGTAMWRPRL